MKKLRFILFFAVALSSSQVIFGYSNWEMKCQKDLIRLRSDRAAQLGLDGVVVLDASANQISISVALKAAARKFHIEQYGSSGEADIPDLGITKRWELVEIKQYEGSTLLVMQLVTETKIKDTNEVAREVDPEFQILVLKNTDPKHLEIVPFERAFPMPDWIVVRMAHMVYEDEELKTGASSYVVTLTGESVIAALKSLYSGVRYYGFSGIVLPNRKNIFDFTCGRTWGVVDAVFDLMRGASQETGDVQAYQFDEDFAAYFNGCNQAVTSDGQMGAQIIPWGQSAVVELLKIGSVSDIHIP